MKPILEKFKMPGLAFRPKTTTELFALIIACKLGDSAAVSHYAQLTLQNSESRMLVAFHHAIRIDKAQDLGKLFHLQLPNVPLDVPNGNSVRLIAIRVERRSVAVAVLHGEQLEYCQVRQLPSDKDKVIDSAIRFIIWMTNQFSPDSVAIELIPNGNEIQRRILTDAIIKTMRDRLLPIWEVSKQDLFRAYGYPPLKCRKELRDVITGLWPVLLGANSRTFIQDAVALGLYVQMERRFLH